MNVAIESEGDYPDKVVKENDQSVEKFTHPKIVVLLIHLKIRVQGFSSSADVIATWVAPLFRFLRRLHPTTLC